RGPEHEWVFLRGGRNMKGVVIDAAGWKLCVFRDGTRQLYSLREDHLEQHELAERHPEVVRRLAAVLASQLDSERP
ncbi:MAG: hypothetical protein KAI24_16675, partial [Planctomycetes bacterium]|nr:hypothetical protein [Planctomycetota bacterium]